MVDIEKLSKWASIVKDLAAVALSIVIFLVITKPDSILSRKSTKESISKERAKLLMEVLKEPDVQKIKLTYNIIKCSYYVESDVTSWFWDVDSLINLWISQKEQSYAIDLNQKILSTKISLIRSLKEYNDLRGVPTVVNEIFPGEDRTIKNIETSIRSKNNDFLSFKRISDSLQVKINQKLKKQF